MKEQLEKAIEWAKENCPGPKLYRKFKAGK